MAWPGRPWEALAASPPAQAARRARLWWRGSLSVRVVATTLALSLVVVAALGWLLLDRVTVGLLGEQRSAALDEATAGIVAVQTELDSAQVAAGGDPAQTVALVDQATRDLVARAGTPALYGVLVLTGQPAPVGQPDLGSTAVDPASVPAALRATVAEQAVTAYTYSSLRYTDGRPAAPGLVVGAPLEVPGVAVPYQVFLLFPLTQQASTLSLVRSLLLAAGLGLIALLGLIAWLVTRQVVRPVRSAAGIAEQFSAGRLEQRMTVRGEDDLARLATSFNAMASSLQRQIRQLEDLSRVQRRFVSDVSHELRTPLTTVRMAADFLHAARTDFDPATARSAELLQGQLDRFEALLTDLLEISRFDAGAAVLDVEPVDLRALLARAVDAASPLAQAQGSALELVVPDSACVAEVDPRRVERVLRNLLSNAVDHGEGRPVRIEVAGDTDAVAVTVRDHGVGLRPGESSLVFNRFWRADPARARTTGGTGLGLAIALEDARLHGGWLQAWGAPGDGANFRLTLPRRARSELTASPLPLEPVDARPPRAPMVAAGRRDPRA